MNTQSDNRLVAEILGEMAELLEQRGESAYKARAYRNASETVAATEEPLAEIAARGELRSLHGVGESMEARIQEILTTGTSALYERMKAEADGLEQVEDEVRNPW